jgi:TrmH family RNA methyltransferase
MLSKNQIKDIKQLHLTKFRHQFRQFIAEGPKLVEEFLNSNFRISQIYGTKDWQYAGEHKLQNFSLISDKGLAAISLMSTPNQVIAIIDYPESAAMEFAKGDLIIALDTIQDPGNLGTIIRIADWFGIKKIVCSPSTADAFSPKVVQASMGALTRINITYLELEPWLKELPENTAIYGALLDGKNIYSTDIQQQGIIVIGNESKGISESIEKLITHKIKIPAHSESKMESLNAAIATAIICAEFRRPR